MHVQMCNMKVTSPNQQSLKSESYLAECQLAVFVDPLNVCKCPSYTS